MPGTAVTEATPVRRILSHIGEPIEPPQITPARPCATQSYFAWVPARTIPGSGVRCFSAAHPPDWGDELGPLPDYDAVVPRVPEFQYDQRVSW